MNLHHLKIFYYIAKYGSITKAAKVLGLSQPAVSLQIQDFQSKYNYKFLDILGKKIILTPLGAEVYKKCETIFEIENQIESLINDFEKSKEGLLTIFTTQIFAYYYCPAIIAEFKKKLPSIIIQLQSHNSARVVEETVNLKTDVGIIGYKIEHPSIFLKEILTESLYVICHPDHILSKKRMIMPHDLESHNFITNEKTAGTRRAIDNYLKNNKITLNIIAEIDSPISIVEMVKQNLGISILCKHIITDAVKRKEIISIPISGGLYRYFYLVYHKEKYISTPIKTLITECEKWCEIYYKQNLKDMVSIK